MKCRVCGSQSEPFMSFGAMPIANGFLTPDEFADEYFFELAPVFCEDCGTFQLERQPEPERMFHSSYAFFTRSSQRMVEHFRDFARWVMERHLHGDNSFVVEIGSNDGVMLETFANAGMRHLGIEPSSNVAAEARRHGVDTLVEFFGERCAVKVGAEYGQADAILAANVMCHIPDLDSVARGVECLLAPDGVLIFEDPYLGDVIARTSYDQIYDEHVFIFSAHAVLSIFAPYGLELIDVIAQPTHGGSMRYVLARAGCRAVAPTVAAVLAREARDGLDRASTFDAFRTACERSRERFVGALERERQAGKRVVGYGATSKSTTVLNYCNVGPDLIEFISDTTPIKQGKFSPGRHVPVRAYEEFQRDLPDTAVLFAWNHSAEIMEKEAEFTSSGRRWLCHVEDAVQGRS